MANEEDTPIEELPPSSKESSVSSANSGTTNPWIPVLVMIIALPVLIFVTVEIVLIPRMQKALSQVSPNHTQGQNTTEVTPTEELYDNEAHASKPYANFEFKDIVANLSGSMQTRYIKTTFTVAGNDPEFVEIMQKNRAKLIDATLRILSSLTIKDLDNPGIQNTVRSDLLALFDSVLKGKVIKEIYFSEFVAQ